MKPAELMFTKSHEWIEPSGARRKVGISDFAQHQLGDIVYVDFPAPGKAVRAGEEVCIIESTKATSGIYAPVAGTVVAFNSALTSSPELINQEPYDGGWLYELELADGAALDGLMDHAAYAAAQQED